MNTNPAVGAAALPPHARLIQMATAYWVSRLLYATAKYGLADRLADGPKTASELAGETGTHAPSLHRLMRALASLGVLSEDARHRFALAPLGEALRSDAPGAARATILAIAGDWWWRGWEHVLYCLETGKTGMQKTTGMTVFGYLAQHPQEAAYFNDAMVGFHGDEPRAVADACDFSHGETVVDVGGGTGNLLAAILERHPSTHGILADVPHVIDEARTRMASLGVLERCDLQAIDFFESVPAGGDVYLLSHVIHDWTEEECLAMPPSGAETSLMSVRSFVHISAVALAFTAAAVFGSMRPTAQQSVVIAGVTTQVTSDPGRHGDPSISGSVVVWTDQRHGNDDIFYRDGLGPEIQLTNSPINQNVHDVSGRIVVYSDRTQPGFVRAIDLTTNTEIGVFGPRAAWPRIDGPHRRVCLTVTESREDQLFGEIQ